MAFTFLYILFIPTSNDLYACGDLHTGIDLHACKYLHTGTCLYIFSNLRTGYQFGFSGLNTGINLCTSIFTFRDNLGGVYFLKFKDTIFEPGQKKLYHYECD